MTLPLFRLPQDPAASQRSPPFVDPSPYLGGMPGPAGPNASLGPTGSSVGKQLLFDCDDASGEWDMATHHLPCRLHLPSNLSALSFDDATTQHFGCTSPSNTTPSTLRRGRRSTSQVPDDGDDFLTLGEAALSTRRSKHAPLRPITYEVRTGAQSWLSLPQTVSSAASSPLCSQYAHPSSQESTNSFDAAVPSSSMMFTEPEFEVGFFTHCGPRSTQEDRFFFNYVQPPLVTDAPRTYLAAVYDGHNGSATAELAASHLHEFVCEDPNFSTALDVALVNALRRFDISLHESKLHSNSGSTALVVCVRGRTLTVANLGDCRAVVGFKDGSVLPLTVDHRSGEASEKVRVLQHVDARRLEGLSVTRGLADFQLKPPEGILSGNCALSNIADITTFQLDDTCDFVLLASDGLWDRMSNEVVVSFLHERFRTQRERFVSVADEDDDGASQLYHSPCDTPRGSVGSAVRDLINSVVDQASDNMTAVCLRFV